MRVQGQVFKDDQGNRLVFRTVQTDPRTGEIVNLIFEDEEGGEVALRSWSEVTPMADPDWVGSRQCVYLHHMIEDERKAPKDYQDLLAVLPKSYHKEIEDIIRDEQRHAKRLAEIREEVCKLDLERKSRRR
jgi:hypothetical protein